MVDPRSGPTDEMTVLDGEPGVLDPPPDAKSKESIRIRNTYPYHVAVVKSDIAAKLLLLMPPTHLGGFDS